MFEITETYLFLLTCQGPGCGYYTKPSKSVLIMHPENIKARKVFGARHGFKVHTGARYLGGDIEDEKPKHDWLREYRDMGEECLHDQKNCGEISPGELRCGGTRNLTRVDISTTCHLGYGGRVCGSG